MNREERGRITVGGSHSWKQALSPKECGVGSGWFGEMDRAYQNGKYAVMVRTIDTPFGKVDHACIRNVPNTDIPWAEKQKIKNELFGKERVAVEVFPKESELVDEANMYHLWVFPEGYSLPFGL